MKTLGSTYQQMKKRMEDLTPVGDRVHRELLDWQRKEHIPPEQRLGPSLSQPQHGDHVFRMRDREIIFGTRVPYSLAHQAYRLRQGRDSHLRVSREVVVRVSRIIGEWIVRGVR